MSQCEKRYGPAAAEISRERFLTVATVDALQAESNADILTRFRNDEVHAVVIKNVFSPAECDAIVADLESNRHGFPRTFFPEPFKSFFFGANLNLAHPDLSAYFDLQPAFDIALTSLMNPYGGFQSRVLSLLSALDGGKSYKAPPGPTRDRSYMATTVRAHLEQGFIPPHFDNEQMKRPSFRHLTPLIEGDLFSFVITLQRASKDGALQVYDVTADCFAGNFVNDDRERPKPDLSTRDSVTFGVENGTMVLVRSGRYLHRLTPVSGNTTRWTLCSFMAKSRAEDAVFCWG